MPPQGEELEVSRSKPATERKEKIEPQLYEKVTEPAIEHQALIERQMLERTLDTTVELERKRTITATLFDKKCEADYEVEDIEEDIRVAEARLKYYTKTTGGKVAAWVIQKVTGYPLVAKLTQKIDDFHDDLEEALTNLEEATKLWMDASEEEKLQAEMNRSRKGNR